MWIPRPSIVWPLTLTRVLFSHPSHGHSYVTLICIRFPLYTELFQLPMPASVPFLPLPEMPPPFPFAPLFCLIHSYSFFDLSESPGAGRELTQQHLPTSGRKPVLLPLYSSSTWLNRYIANYVPQHACKSPKIGVSALSSYKLCGLEHIISPLWTSVVTAVCAWPCCA